MFTRRHRPALATVATALMACSGAGSTISGPPGRHARAPTAAGQVAELARAGDELAVSLYDALVAAPDATDNLFFSPYSISAALGMTYAGARGETERQMAEALRFSLPQAELHAAFGRLNRELQSRAEVSTGDGEPFRLETANALWAAAGAPFRSDFIDNARDHYAAAVRSLDFWNDSESARRTINAWVSDQTETLIPQLIPEGALGQDTQMVLTNTVYFRASWAVAFETAQTVDAPFLRLDGSAVDVPMMRGLTTVSYADTSDCQVVVVPYVGNEIALVLLVPDEGDWVDFERSLSAARLADLLSETRDLLTQLSMPRWETRSSAGLRQVLGQMGMPIAFTPQANFSGMRDGGGLMIDEVIHEAVIKVDEAGTEAAAATAVIVVPVSSPGPTIHEITVDRPFVYLIRDAETGAILFMGRFLDPTAGPG